MRNFKLFNLVYLYPIVVLLIQIVPSQIALLSGLSFIFGAIAFKNLRSLFLLFSGTILGHLAWAYFAIFLTNYDFSVSLSAILARLGLLAYIVFFSFWFYLSPSQARFFNLGDFKAIIYFPLVWQGKKESIWRFILIFSLLCLLIIFVLAFNTQLSWELIIFGLVFSIVNSSLEEILWRGLILTRIMDFLTPQYSLIVSSLAFGVYHISLGFSLWACFAFVLGGFYFGGTAIKSQGLLAPWIMHIVVNIVFVFMGLIF